MNDFQSAVANPVSCEYHFSQQMRIHGEREYRGSYPSQHVRELLYARTCRKFQKFLLALLETRTQIEKILPLSRSGIHLGVEVSQRVHYVPGSEGVV